MGAIALEGRGVNEVGHDAGNATAVQGNVLPWLQDDALEDAWHLWDVTLRDCIVVDAFGRAYGIMNLTSHDLNDPTHYDALKLLILEASTVGP